MNNLSTSQNLTVAAYYFPGFHAHPKFDSFKSEGFSEWDLVVNAPSRFPGHDQPRIPLWGAEDESDFRVMEKKIRTAVDHGIDVFIFDWYYHDDGPFLEKALDDGFLHAENSNCIKFALMWANHDWCDIQGHNPADGEPRLLFPGKVSAETWDKITDLVIQKYFMRENYWKINGCPFFSIYEMSLFLEPFGSMDAARQA